MSRARGDDIVVGEKTTRAATWGRLRSVGGMLPDIAPEREIGRVPPHIDVPDAVALMLLVLFELLAVVAVIAIWRERGRPWAARLIWTAVTLVPVVGLVAFLVWRDPPPRNDPIDRPPRNPYA